MSDLPRRDFLVGATAGSIAALTGCASSASSNDAGPWHWRPNESEQLGIDRPDFDLVRRGLTSGNLLRQRARAVPTGLDLRFVANRMEETMRTAGGVGIAGPQIGFSLRVAIVVIDPKTPSARPLFVRNPTILERADETMEGYEGCLSIPEVGGLVRRSEWVVVRYHDLHGEECVRETSGFEAVIWQHELDHLDGVLFVDRLIGELLPMDEVRRRRKAESTAQSKTPPPRLVLA